MEWTSGVRDDGDGKAVHDELVEGEERLESNSISINFDVLWLLHDWQVLLVDVDKADRAGVRAVVLEAKFEVLALRLNVLGVDS